MTFSSPTMPTTQGLFQNMVDMFGTAGTIGLAIIGGAVALGILVVLARWGWGLLKGWLEHTNDNPQYSDDYMNEISADYNEFRNR